VNHQEKLQSFEHVVLRHLQSAFALARWYLRNEDDAKDLVQEAILRAFKAFDTFRGEDGRVWLFTIIRNLHLSGVSRKTPEQTSFDEEIHLVRESFGNPEVLLIRDAESKVVQQAIEGLMSEFREVLVLRELEGLSYREIAEITKAPLGTVMSRLSRAREHLQKSLALQMDKDPVPRKDGRNALSGK